MNNNFCDDDNDDEQMNNKEKSINDVVAIKSKNGRSIIETFFGDLISPSHVCRLVFGLGRYIILIKLIFILPQVETNGTSTVVFMPYFAVIQAGELRPYF